MQVIIDTVPLGSVKNWDEVKSLMVAKGAQRAYVVVTPFQHFNVVLRRNGRLYKATAMVSSASALTRALRP